MNAVIGLAVFFGMLIGAVLAGFLIFWLGSKDTKPPVNKAKSSRQQRRESMRKATLNAQMMVESGAFTDPTRR
jgi:membrane protein DedA with SNARE-associated domain